MRLLVVLMLCVALARALDKVEIDKNEFAEFDLEEEDLVVEKLAPEKLEPQEADEDEVKVEEEDFDHYQDEEEFEGVISDNKPSRSRNPEKPDLKITKVPLHFRRHWEHFYLELLMIAGLVVYCSAFVLGRSRNHQLAQAWLQAHRPLLESNFALVGDDGRKDLEGSGGLVKESENVYTLWCSGRLCVEGMLVELKLLKRQDLLSMITNLIKPSTDQINVRVEMSADSMDSFVMCLGTKKSISKIAKEMQDASTYCPEKKNVDKYGLSSNFNLLNEIGEVASAMLDAKFISMLKKYEEYIDCIHFSDQYTGNKVQEDNQPGKHPEPKKVLIFSFNAPNLRYSSADQMESLKPLLQLVFYCVEKVRKFRLSKEGKSRAEKHRQRVEEAYLKTTHAQRQEAAQLRREERRRAEKERIMNEEDPEKQRKWEEREHRRELKKKAPKLKQMKVKSV